MDVINREREGEKEVSSLVVGTEAQMLLVLDPACTNIDLGIKLPSIPTHLAIQGLLQVDHRINIACRDGVVYAVKDKTLMATRIEVGTLISGMVRTEPQLYIGGIDSKLHAFQQKGKRLWTLPLPAAITAMARVTLRRCVAANVGGSRCAALSHSRALALSRSQDGRRGLLCGGAGGRRGPHLQRPHLRGDADGAGHHHRYVLHW